jgi:hypothetical protein
LTGDLAGRPVTESFVCKDGKSNTDAIRAIKLRSLLQARCARCHAPGKTSKATNYPLDTYEHLQPYVAVKVNKGMEMEKLAQTTHVHLLGFSMLYGLTGLLLALSSYPAIVRLLLAPLPLVAQVVDISFWWLARLDGPYGPMFAQAIAVSGAVVAVGLLLHIVLGLWELLVRAGEAS